MLLGNESDIRNHDVLCAYHPGYFAASTSETLNCTAPTVARYVSIKNGGNFERNLFALCEVVVMGNKAIGELYPNITFSCYCVSILQLI